MPTISNTSFDQLKVITDALNGYFSAVEDYINGDSATLPMFEDVASLLRYDEIFNDAIRGEKLAANFTTGALVDTVQIVIGINREFNLRAKTKAQFYADASDEYAIESGYYSHLYPTYYNMFRGKSPEQT